MAKSVKQQMGKFSRLLRGIVKDATSEKVMRTVGDRAVGQIQKRTRIGKDVKGEAFKPLKQATKDKRKDETLDPRTRPNKSNVTQTGQLVDSLKVTDVKPRSVEISATGKRADGGSNADVARWVEKAGRKFMGLTNKERERIVNFYRKIVRDLTRKANKK